MTERLPMLDERRRALENCGFCPKLCRAVCPVSAAERRESLTPWGKMTLAWLDARGDAPPERSAAKTAWGCTGCSACSEVCHHDNPVADTLLDARAAHLARGLAPKQAAEIIDRYEGRKSDIASSVQLLVDMPRVSAEASTALLVGCTTLLHFPTEARATVRVAAELAGPVRVVSRCCGLPLAQAGDAAGFERAQRELAEELAGAQRVLVADPGCARTLAAGSYELLVKLAFRALPRLRPLPDLAERGVRWHDPCHLGRGLGVYDEPRAILTRLCGSAPAEFPRHRQQSICSGGGGALPAVMPEASDGIARGRLEDHDAAGGGVLVTGCGASLRRFRKSGADARDLFTLVARALE